MALRIPHNGYINLFSLPKVISKTFNIVVKSEKIRNLWQNQIVSLITFEQRDQSKI
jgi:hypothetical protein